MSVHGHDPTGYHGAPGERRQEQTTSWKLAGLPGLREFMFLWQDWSKATMSGIPVFYEKEVWLPGPLIPMLRYCSYRATPEDPLASGLRPSVRPLGRRPWLK